MKLPPSLIQKVRRGATGEKVSLTPENKKLLKAFTGHPVPCLCGGGKNRQAYLKEVYRLYNET